METTKNYLLVNKWVYLMVAFSKFEKQSINQIGQKLVITYSHLIKIVRAIEDKGWMTFEKKGRKLEYKFTELGKKVLHNCQTQIEFIEGKNFWLLKKSN